MATLAQDITSIRDSLGIILDSNGDYTGTCFQIADGVLVTAYHVVEGTDVDQSVQFEPINGGQPHLAKIKGVDQQNDIAVLTTDHPLPGIVSHLAHSEVQQPDTSVYMVGYGELPEAQFSAEYRYLPATGTWEGSTHYIDGTLLARARADGVARGMSGCPILRNSDSAVVGILSKRYNTVDGWSSGRIWISRIEDLQPLLTGLTQVAIEHTAPSQSSQISWLTEIPIDRKQILEDKYFFQPDQWSDAWDRGSKAINNGKIVIIAAPPGIGATTFAEQLLARTTGDRTRLMRLDPGDWDEPSALALPIKPWRAYILDLRDPEHDVPPTDFVNDLAGSATVYKSYMSRLIITITEDLLIGKAPRLPSGVELVRLQVPPEPKTLAQSYLKNSPRLSSLVEKEAVASHLEGMNAVQVMQVIDKINGIISVNQAISSDETYGEIERRIIDVLDDHAEELDRLFADVETDYSNGESASKRGGKDRRLSLHDRCLLISLAFHGTRRLSRLQDDSQLLSDTIQGKSTTAVTLTEILNGAGVRGRIIRIKGRADHGENINFERPSLGEAAVRYVWDNYPAIRKPVAEWLFKLSCKNNDDAITTARWLSDLIQRHQDVGFLKDEVVKLAREHDQNDLLAEITYNSTINPHTRRRCERLLYDWAVRPELQSVVISVCAKILLTTEISSERRGIALTRLRRVVDSGRANQLRQTDVLAAFQNITNSSLRAWFFDATGAWYKRSTNMTSAKLAFTASAPIVIDGIPWILRADTATPEINQVLGEILADFESTPGAYPIVEDLLKKVSVNNTLYDGLVDLLSKAFVRNGAIMPLFKMNTQLEKLGPVIGRNVSEDIVTRVKLELANSERLAPAHETLAYDGP